ncbi:hypothetical protein BLNAU_21742 [Blattamonas nauphoetae]|uniref:Uncharacterized protein n=1 Tax=Blattamonas nauphoetae TaxID=2049346 RepID=A0ABQ9WX97_9EUKA|nr:hypothetical protein BLNAU_21742 [Blattamonas nauphoetae]
MIDVMASFTTLIPFMDGPSTRDLWSDGMCWTVRTSMWMRQDGIHLHLEQTHFWDWRALVAFAAVSHRPISPQTSERTLDVESVVVLLSAANKVLPSLTSPETCVLHISLLHILNNSFSLATRDGLAQLASEDDDELQAVHETILSQVVIPSEKWICDLCVNRLSMIVGVQSRHFEDVHADLLEMCACHHPTMDVVLHVPVSLPIQVV